MTTEELPRRDDALLTVADVARIRGCDRVTAWRLLKQLERDHGVKLIKERRTIYVDRESVAVIVAAEPARKSRRMEQQIGQLRRRLEAVEAKQKATDAELRAFRKMAHEWFTKNR